MLDPGMGLRDLSNNADCVNLVKCLPCLHSQDLAVRSFLASRRPNEPFQGVPRRRTPLSAVAEHLCICMRRKHGATRTQEEIITHERQIRQPLAKFLADMSDDRKIC